MITIKEELERAKKKIKTSELMSASQKYRRQREKENKEFMIKVEEQLKKEGYK